MMALNSILTELSIMAVQNSNTNDSPRLLSLDAYRGLIMLCEQLEYADAAKVLNKNLQEEQMTAKKLEQSMPELLADAMPTAKKSR